MYFKIEEYTNNLNRNTSVVIASDEQQARAKYDGFDTINVKKETDLQTLREGVFVTKITKQQYNKMKGDKRWRKTITIL